MAKQTEAAPWERQPKETAKAFEAFFLYLHMGAERGIRAVAQKLGKSVTLISRWSSDWDWVERTRAWDNDLAQKAKKRAEKDIEEMQKRHISISMHLQSKAIKALGNMSTESITARDVAALIKLGVDVERLSRGEPTERTEGNVTGAVSVSNPYTGLTTEELRKLAAATEDSENEDS